jgi:hypothetical protein
MKNLGFVLIAVSLAFSSAIFHFATKDTVQFTVEHRERVVSTNNGQSKSRFMIWGNTGNQTEVFENVDSWLAFKFNSADVYGAMTVGAVCEATVTGWRVPMLSWNRNILRADCRSPTQGATG